MNAVGLQGSKVEQNQREEMPENEKAWRGRRMRQALNLIDNWEEEDVVDPYRTTLGGGVCCSMSRDIG